MDIRPQSNTKQTYDLSLADLSLGESARIGGFGSPEVEMAMLKLGVKVGDLIVLTGKAPFGGPFAIGVRNTKISLRKNDAAHIWISKSPAVN